MAIFTQALSISLGIEGGYCNNPKDSGGETYAGISRRNWPEWKGWPIVQQIIATHPSNLNIALKSNTLLQQEVQQFYKANFWDALNLDYINCQQIANQLFDAGINQGMGTAGRLLQQAINAITPNTVVVDGSAGPKTIEAANAANAEALYNHIIALRREYYLNIIARDPSLAVFEHSWLSRLTPFNENESIA